jgi:uncharacterized membrane protein
MFSVEFVGMLICIHAELHIIISYIVSLVTVVRHNAKYGFRTFALFLFYILKSARRWLFFQKSVTAENFRTTLSGAVVAPTS